MFVILLLLACAHSAPPVPPPAAAPNVEAAPAPPAPPPVMAPNSVAALQYHGVYRSQLHGDSWSYIRFYADGSAVQVGSTGTPADLKAWFHHDRQDLAVGSWTLEGAQLHLPTKSPSGIVVWDGVIDGQGRLRLHWASQINGNEGDDVLEFVAW